MNKRVVIAGLVVLVALLLALVFFGGREHDWSENYRKPQSEEPYGLVALRRLLTGFGSEHKLVDIELKTSTQLNAQAKGNYVVVGEAMFLDSADMDAVVSFVKRGNTAFLSTKSIPFDLMFHLYYEECPMKPSNKKQNYQHNTIPDNEYVVVDSGGVTAEVPTDDDTEYMVDEDGNLVEMPVDEYEYEEEEPVYQANVNTTIPWGDYAFNYKDSMVFDLSINNKTVSTQNCAFFRNKFDTLEYRYSFIAEQYFCGIEGGLEPLGNVNGNVNFARVKLGKGYVYLHTTPLQFTNLHMSDSTRAMWAGQYWSVLQDGDIFWDSYCLKPEMASRQRNQRNERGGTVAVPPQTSPLTILLSKPPLALGWYLLLGAGFFYVVFGAKRRQRATPVLAAVENDSMAYVQTVSQLHFGSGNHRAMIISLKQVFQRQAAQKYGIAAADWQRGDAARIARLAKVPESICRTIMEQFVNAEVMGDAQSLVSLHNAIQAFETYQDGTQLKQ